MVSTSYTSFNCSDRSYLAILKKEIHKLALQGGFEAKQLAEIDLIVSELGSNLVKHASGGEMLAGILQTDDGMTLELIGLDNGPGMTDPEKMMADGASTTQTLGHGLGSIRRLSDTFELYSRKDWGTILLSRVHKKKTASRRSHKAAVQINALVVPKPGETLSGDGWYYMAGKNGVIHLLVADGLGHGAEAHRAVKEAVSAFRTTDSESPAEILRHLHQSIKRTRGIVATVVIIDPKEKTWRLCGIGNIGTRLIGYQQSKSYLPYNGIIGSNIPNTLNDQELSQHDYQQIVLCSDGIRSRWEHAKHPTIGKYDLSIQAAAIYKDFGRKTDDMSVIIGRALS
ncbi:MAG TPA: ATP-binding protein [Puia sp.]|nr:ATP-binding protein [Puia sp.]